MIEKRSKFKGVIWDPGKEQWVAYATGPNGKYVHLGWYTDEREASRASANRQEIYQSVMFEDDFSTPSPSKHLERDWVNKEKAKAKRNQV